ncbi:hypothetical protein AVEN_152240-1 [Araneus ventricosus]|uniref:Reverse transcriptase domain-containing protein n=1 Tax=Araneus ventricosus TaxID=182803 RepID=A0A4Y2KC29_ARAVE|nr:hypothetical protein AVEN_152240-1 [Araneus ventricosus]
MKHEPIPLDYCGDCNSHHNIPIHLQEVRQAIQKTWNSTPGADGITANWFKKLSNTDLISITSFFQEVFATSYIPEEWKHSIIVPIPKPNKDKTKINSYRPIALTCAFSKIFERILIQRITHHLLTEEKIPPSVNGFLPLRDNQLAVYKIHTAISEAHSYKKYFIGISLDIKSAYDTVYIDGLIFKCLQLGIAGNITKVLHNFLQNRTLQVRCGEIISLGLNLFRKFCFKAVSFRQSFSCSITNKFSEAQYKACNSIQTMALRVALRLTKWTPNIVLMKIAGQEVLSEKSKRLAVQFFIRQLANGAHSPIYDQNCNPSIKLIKRYEVMIANLFTDLDTSTDHIIAFPDTLISRNNFCEIHLSDFSFQNKAHPVFLNQVPL